MKIKLRCQCGATAEFEEDPPTPIKMEQETDDKGRGYLIELRADEWQERHQVCLDRPSKKKPEKGPGEEKD